MQHEDDDDGDDDDDDNDDDDDDGDDGGDDDDDDDDNEGDAPFSTQTHQHMSPHQHISVTQGRNHEVHLDPEIRSCSSNTEMK